jgi:sulfate adenylyltransferase
MPRPHGGKLVNRLVPENKKNSVEDEVNELDQIEVSQELRLDLENIAFGLYSPLKGPINKNDYLSITENGRLTNDIPWTIPIILDIKKKNVSKINEGDLTVLSSHGEKFATLYVEDIYRFNKKKHSQNVYKTLDHEHPGVAKTLKLNDYLVGGTIKLFKEYIGKFPKYRLKPIETRFLFKEKGWRSIAGFQTRNAPHIGHEYVQKTALAFVDGLFINPLIGKKKKGDFKDEIILNAYEALIKNYYLMNSATLVTLEMEMRYAGPKEAIHHAIIRKNYGCTHFIVGRDHAGVGSYYDPFEAQDIFDAYPDLEIMPIFFRNFFHCKKCGGPQNDKICPHDEKDHQNYSGRSIRELLLEGKRPGSDMMRPEVVDVILSYKMPFVE